jgi:hypothetical protein
VSPTIAQTCVLADRTCVTLCDVNLPIAQACGARAFGHGSAVGVKGLLGMRGNKYESEIGGDLEVARKVL